MIKHMTPLFRSAIREGKKLFFACELWLSVLNKSIDTLADFQASTNQVNCDFTSYAGSARIAIEPSGLVIEQLSHNTNLALDAADSLPGYPSLGLMTWVWQGWPLDTPRLLDAVTLRFDATGAGGDADVWVFVISGLQHWTSNGFPAFGNNYTIHHSWYIPIANGFTGDKRVAFTDKPLLPAGQYWLWVVPRYNRPLAIRYQNSDVFTGGALETQKYGGFGVAMTEIPGIADGNVIPYEAHAAVTGDLYFKIELSAYYPAASFTTKVLDVGKVPDEDGEFQMASSVPEGCTMRVDLKGSNNADLSAPVVYENIQDGSTIAPRRYWWSDVYKATNAARDATSEIDRMEVVFPDARRHYRQLGLLLRHVAADVQNMAPFLVPGEYKASELKVLERISSIGEFNVSLRSASRDPLQLLVSDHPLQNYRCRLFLGADVPGFKRADLFRYFSGIIKSPKTKPKFERDHYELSLKVSNPMMELKRKIPAPQTTGVVSLGDIAINRDKVHVCDSMVDDIRGEAAMPARFVDLNSFRSAKTRVGGGSLAPAMFVIRRSNAAGLPDTRIQSPEELRKLLEPQCFICDGYIIMDELSRLSLLLHDANAAHEETWADAALVRAGLNAVPIYDMADVDLMYEEWLYNVVLCGCDWTGASGKWETFNKKYAYAEGGSINEFGMGEAEHVSILDKPLIEASKWLGPETGYGGETLARYISEKLGRRFAYPPAVIKGAVVPVSQLERGTGAVVRIISKEFAKLGRRGISPSETKKFMLLGPKYDQGKNRVVTDLVELT